MKKKYIKHLLISMAMICMAPFACAEYLLVKENKTAQGFSTLTEPEYEEAYDILMKYQFPMNTAQAWHLEQELTPQELKEMFTQEHSFLQKKIAQAMDDTIKVIFIPTTIYEILTIVLLEENPDVLNFDALFYHTIWVINASRSKDLFDLYNHPNLLQLHHFINDHVVQKINLQKIAINLLQIPYSESEKILIEQKDDFITIILKRFAKYQKAYDTAWPMRPKKDVDQIDQADPTHVYDILLKALNFEYEAYEKGCHVLYRGTAGNDSPIAKTDSSSLTLKPYSLSYGQTLFGGYYEDPGACAFRFIIMLDQSYALLLNKYEYYNTTRTTLFFLPPLSTHMSLLGMGEYFHPRGKVFLNDESWPLGIGDENSDFLALADSLAKQIINAYLKTDLEKFKTAKKFEQTFTDFIQKNCRMFKSKGSCPADFKIS